MKIAIYCRISEGQTLNKQLKACTDYANEQSYEIVNVFVDFVKGDVHKRPAFRKMMSDSSFKGILMSGVDRITRDKFVYFTVKQELMKLGKIVTIPNEHELDGIFNATRDILKSYEVEKEKERRG